MKIILFIILFILVFYGYNLFLLLRSIIFIYTKIINSFKDKKTKKDIVSSVNTNKHNKNRRKYNIDAETIDFEVID